MAHEMFEKLWDGLEKSKSIYDLAVSMGFPPEQSTKQWRRTIITLAKDPEFWTAKPEAVNMPVDVLEKWRQEDDAFPKRKLGRLQHLVRYYRRVKSA